MTDAERQRQQRMADSPAAEGRRDAEVGFAPTAAGVGILTDHGRRVRDAAQRGGPMSKTDRNKEARERLTQEIANLEGTIEHSATEAAAHKKQIEHSQAELKRYTAAQKKAEADLRAKKARLKKLL